MYNINKNLIKLLLILHLVVIVVMNKIIYKTFHGNNIKMNKNL